MSQTPAILVERGLQPSYPARRIWRAWWSMVDDGSQFKARSLVTLTELEASGALHQVGDAPKIVDRVRQSEMGENSGLTRSTVTKRISLLAGPVLDQKTGAPLWTTEKREKQSDKMKRIAGRHPHWQATGQRREATGHRPQATGGDNNNATEDQARCSHDSLLPDQAGIDRVQHSILSAAENQSGSQSPGENREYSTPPWLLVRNSGFATPNSYALGTDDRRPGMKAASDPCEHARWLASHFGAHLFDPTAQLNGFRKDMGFWSAPELPDAPDCECVRQRRLALKEANEKETSGGKCSRSSNPSSISNREPGECILRGADLSPSARDGQLAGLNQEENDEDSGDAESSADLDCPKCGGCGYTIGTPTEENGYKGTMGDYDRLVGRWLNDRGIDQEIRWCKTCKRSYSQDSAPHYPHCPGCNSGAESEIRKHRGILEGYSMQEIADANGLHVSTVQRIFKVFRRLMLIRTVYGKKWRQCQMCRGAWYEAKECPKCGNKCGEIKASEKAKHLWLPVRYMDKWLALAEKQRLEALVERQERLHLVPEQLNALKLAVAAAVGLLYQWEGHEHQLQSFYNELRRRLDTDQFRRFLNLLFPLPVCPPAGKSPPDTG